jgi:glutaminyl-tRNA synthetase
MGVLRPLKVVIENYPEGQVEELEAVNNPVTRAGSRKVPFSRELYIEQEDFREVPPPKFFRLRRGAKCVCDMRTSSPARKSSGCRKRRGSALHLRSRNEGGNAPDGRSPRPPCIGYPRRARHPQKFASMIGSLPMNANRGNGSESKFFGGSKGLACRAEPRERHPGDRFQFERMGYFCVDLDSKPGPRLQPHRHASRYLDQDREKGAEVTAPVPDLLSAARIVSVFPSEA